MLHPTGVDRVERAYLRALLADSKSQLFGISRTALGFVLLDRRGCLAVATALDSGAWGDADLLSKFNPRLDQARRIGQSFVRRIAFKKARKSRLLAMLETHLPRNYTYINVGHSNLNPRMFDGVDAAQKVVLIHDTIPLDLPNTQRLGARDEFYQKLKLVSERADRVICTSSQCEADVRRHLDKIGRVPPITTALLGIDVPVLDTKSHPPESPYFVCVGTIEPRKNHALLLDIWKDWGAEAPPLYICGKRGWNNEAVFARLDAGIPNVIEQNDLSDAQIATLLSGASAMLFPSYSEGFGLPPAEALTLDCRVVCADLPVYGEILGNSAVYVDVDDRYLWEKTIKKLAVTPRSDPEPRYEPPTWAVHFKTVLTVI